MRSFEEEILKCLEGFGSSGRTEATTLRVLYLQSCGRTAGEAAWRFNPGEAGSGVMGNQLSHSLELAIWLNGSIVEVQRLLEAVAASNADQRWIDTGRAS